MDSTTRLEQLRFSYDEVLDATKHQDDKVGRFLEAIAFLTAGALVLFDSTFNIGRPFQLGAEAARLPIELWLVLAFLVLALGAAAFLLMSLGPQVAPVSPIRRRRGANERSRSLVFYGAIAGRSLDDWRSAWSTFPSTTQQQIEESLIDEIYSLAVRVETKHNHSLRARSLFSSALACLVIALLCVVRGIGLPTGPAPANWSWTFTGVLAAAFAGLTALSAYDQFSKSNDRQALKHLAGHRSGIGRPSWRITLPALLASVAAASVRYRPGWLLAGGLAIDLGWASSLLWPLARAERERGVRLIDAISVSTVCIAATGLAMPFAFRSIGNIWRFVEAFAPLTLLEAWRFWTPELRSLARTRPDGASTPVKDRRAGP